MTMNIYQQRLSNNIKHLRKQLGVSQENLADRLNVDVKTISNWENDRSQPGLMELIMLADIFGMSIDDLIFKNKFVQYNQETVQRAFAENNSIPYIRTIHEKGFYTIVEQDLEECFPYLRFDLPYIAVMVVGLRKYGFNVSNMYLNGFDIYLNSQEEAAKFVKAICRIEDDIMHNDDSESLKYINKTIDIVQTAELEIVENIFKEIVGEYKYYWKDEFDNIRGYGMSIKECREQAQKQGCKNYDIV